MFFRQLLNDRTACASYVVACKSHAAAAVIDAHQDLVDEYLRLADEQGIRILAVVETHLQADHVSGLPELVARTGATAYLPEGTEAEFEFHPLADEETIELGNVQLKAIATPGHADAHHAYQVVDRTRSPEPWIVLTGDALLVGDAGRPDLHGQGRVAERGAALYRSLNDRLLTFDDGVLLFPAHFSGSVCGRGLSATPMSTIGYERRHNPALQYGDQTAFVEALTSDAPPPPVDQAEIVAANRRGRPLAARQ